MLMRVVFSKNTCPRIKNTYTNTNLFNHFKQFCFANYGDSKLTSLLKL